MLPGPRQGAAKQPQPAGFAKEREQHPLAGRLLSRRLMTRGWMMSTKKKATGGVTNPVPVPKPKGLQALGPDLYAQIRAALLELSAAH
jgi:hypothetical protein